LQALQFADYPGRDTLPLRLSCSLQLLRGIEHLADALEDRLRLLQQLADDRRLAVARELAHPTKDGCNAWFQADGDAWIDGWHGAA
jgi:hypothetical protein